MSEATLTVVKCGGGLTQHAATICRDLADPGHGPVVLVHGGAPEVDALAGRLGVPQRRLETPTGTSSRYTDAETLEVLTMALAGVVKPALVASLNGLGVHAVGLTGLDSRLLLARRRAVHRALLDGRRRVIHDDHSGRITAVNPEILELLLNAGHLPVVSPPAIGEDGTPVNVDADRAAAAIAVAMTTTRQVRLVLLTSTTGFLADPADEASVLDRLDVQDARATTAAGGGMTVKLHAATQALDGGVASVVIADGRTARPVTDAMAGSGTTLVRGDRHGKDAHVAPSTG